MPKGHHGVELSKAELAGDARRSSPSQPGFKTGALGAVCKNVGPARDGALTTPGADQEVALHGDIEANSFSRKRRGIYVFRASCAAFNTRSAFPPQNRQAASRYNPA